MTKPLSCVTQYFTPTDSTSPKVNNFNIIRFFAAFMVIYGHMSSIMGYAAFPLFSQRVSTIAVKIFFIVSGYLITKSYLSDSNFGRYMIRRTFRIFPALIVLVLLTVLVVGPLMTTLPLSEYFANANTWTYFKNLLFSPVYALPGVLTDATYPFAINGSLWTLPVEFAMYLLLPIFVILFKKLGSVKWGMGAMAVITLTASILQITCFPTASFVVWGNDLFQTLPLLPYFFIGSFFSFPEMKKYFNLQAAIALVILASFTLANAAVMEVVVALVLPYFILSLALCEKPIFSKWFSKCDFSYGLYLYGFMIQQIVYGWLAPYNIPVLPMALICFAATLIVAIPSWYLVEKNAQKLGQAWIARLKAKA